MKSNLIAVLIVVALAATVGMANWRERHRQAPRRDVAADARHAEELLRQARLTASPRFAVEAEGLLTRALAEDPASPQTYEARRALASVYLSRHRFRDAIAIGEQSRTERPLDPINYGIIGDGHLELGDYQEAFDAFDRMMQLRPSAAAYARVAYARELQGDLAAAVTSMTLAAEATAPDDREGLAWARAQLGELYLQMGSRRDAKREFTAASHAFPGHPFAVMGYAKTIAAEGNLAGGIDALTELAARAPTPDVYARLGEWLERMGRRDEAERQYALAESAWRMDAPEPKNLARFLADRGRKVDEAVAIAERAAEERHDIFTDDALAWTYYKAGRIDEAKRAIARALRTGTKDREILGHAEAICGRG